jgi:hypothetical protein
MQFDSRRHIECLLISLCGRIAETLTAAKRGGRSKMNRQDAGFSIFLLRALR